MNQMPATEETKEESTPQTLPDRLRYWAGLPLRTAKTWWEKSQNLAHTNYELGREMVRRDKINDAIFRFRMALWFEPTHSEAWYHLGCCYITKGKMEEAVAAFDKALELRPGYEEAIFMRASARSGGKEVPPRMPLSLVINQFEVLAPTYNDIQLVTQGYTGHNQIFKAVTGHTAKDKADHVILELGCGTGLCGMLFRRIKSHLVGVDISTAMLARAADLTGEDGSEIYDELVHDDLITYLKTRTAPEFDIIFASNVFNYIGDLDEVFALSRAALKPGGLFAYSTDVAPPPGYQLVPGTARYGHSVEYLRELGKRHGFEELAMEEILLYSNHRAQQCVLRKL